MSISNDQPISAGNLKAVVEKLMGGISLRRLAAHGVTRRRYINTSIMYATNFGIVLCACVA